MLHPLGSLHVSGILDLRDDKSNGNTMINSSIRFNCSSACKPWSYYNISDNVKQTVALECFSKRNKSRVYSFVRQRV
eukprot:m.242192 g.242192  ORF g.242192 m.242192 type:complete len:77 (+) comp17453_c0_seq21:696-926(+)